MLVEATVRKKQKMAGLHEKAVAKQQQSLDYKAQVGMFPTAVKSSITGFPNQLYIVGPMDKVASAICLTYLTTSPTLTHCTGPPDIRAALFDTCHYV